MDSNPYAASTSVSAQSDAPRPGEPHVADLTEAGARNAKAIVDDADSIYLITLLASCCCAPAWLVMFPWYSWRLWSWYQLNSQFHELRQPYGFSPHGELAVAFQDCRFKLWVGVIAGAIFWILAAFATAVDLLRIVILLV